MSAKGLRSREVKARALVFAIVIVSATARVVAMAGLLPRIAMGLPTGVKGVVRIMVEAKTFIQQDRGARPAALLCLVV